MKIKLGEDRVLPLRSILTGTCEGAVPKVFPLTGATEITVKLLKNDNTYLLKKLTDTSVQITSAADGMFTVTLTDAETALLKPGENMSFDVEVEKGADKRIVEFLNMLTVKK